MDRSYTHSSHCPLWPFLDDDTCQAAQRVGCTENAKQTKQWTISGKMWNPATIFCGLTLGKSCIVMRFYIIVDHWNILKHMDPTSNALDYQLMSAVAFPMITSFIWYFDLSYLSSSGPSQASWTMGMVREHAPKMMHQVARTRCGDSPQYPPDTRWTVTMKAHVLLVSLHSV